MHDSVESIGSRLELFVDRHLAADLKGEAQLRSHNPQPQQVVMEHDEPWEGTGSNYRSVFKDGDIYRMYYTSGQHASGPLPRQQPGLSTG